MPPIRFDAIRTRRTAIAALGAVLGLAAVCLVPGSAPAARPDAGHGRVVDLRPGVPRWLTSGPAFTDGQGAAAIVIPRRNAWPLGVSVQLRSTGRHASYRGSLQVKRNGDMRLAWFRASKKDRVLLDQVTVPGRARPGHVLHVQTQAIGAAPVVLRARSWLDNGPRPQWQLSFSDRGDQQLNTAARAEMGLVVSKKTPVASRVRAHFSGKALSASAVASAVEDTQGTPSSASDVGVPSGTTLTPYYGDLTITTPGTVVSNMDIHGFVKIAAPGVTIRNSVIRGGVNPTSHYGVVSSFGQAGTLIEDSELAIEHPSVRVDGMWGNNFTLRRVHVVGGVDSVKIEGDNVRIEDSLLEGLNNFASDPSQGGGPSHSDNIQILKGLNIVVTGTTALATDNFPLLGGAEQGNISLTATDNYFDGGHCNVKLQVRNGFSQTAVITDNVFGPHRTEPSCPFVAERTVRLRASGNVFAGSGAAVGVVLI